MSQWLIHFSVFAVMFAVPCGLFVLSTVVAQEMRDFFESSALALAAHLSLSIVLTIAGYELLQALANPGWIRQFGLVIHIGFALAAAGWVLGANGCLFNGPPPSKRIGARGIKRYR